MVSYNQIELFLFNLVFFSSFLKNLALFKIFFIFILSTSLGNTEHGHKSIIIFSKIHLKSLLFVFVVMIILSQCGSFTGYILYADRVCAVHKLSQYWIKVMAMLQ